MSAALGVALGAALTGCAPEAADIPISAAAAARPAPQLVETARFTGALEGAAPAVARLEGQRDTLAAAAEDLRARAGALAPPVLDAAERARLEAAARGR